jgi:hypothetical protein
MLKVTRFWLSSESIRYETAPGIHGVARLVGDSLSVERADDDLGQELTDLFFGWCTNDPRWAGWDESFEQAWNECDAAWDAQQAEAGAA